METFGSTPLVRSIDITMCQTYKMHDGPGHDYSPCLPNSPKQWSWSWSWSLPCLTLLRLGPGFGTLFEFRMLEKCPALETPGLSLYGLDALPKGRTVTESDHASSSEQTTSGYMVCPRLTSLTLSGPWVLSPQTLRLLFVDVLPAVVRVATICRGYGVADWLGTTQPSRSLCYATTDLAGPSTDEIPNLGLGGLSVGCTNVL